MSFPDLTHAEKSATLPLRRPSRVRFIEDQTPQGSFSSSFEHEGELRERRGGNSGDFGRLPTLEEGDATVKSSLKLKKSFIAKLGFVSKKKATDTALVAAKTIRPKGALKHVNLAASAQSLQLTSLRRQNSRDDMTSGAARIRPVSESVEPLRAFPLPQQPAFEPEKIDFKSNVSVRRSLSDPSRANAALRHQPHILDALEEEEEQKPAAIPKPTLMHNQPIVTSDSINEDFDESKPGLLKHSDSLPPPPVQIRAPKLSTSSASLDNLMAAVR